MPGVFFVPVRGATFLNDDGTSRQELVKTLRKGQNVVLRADPSNEHDRWAVEVHLENGGQIGFLPSDARDASALLKGEPIAARVHRLKGATNWFSRAILRKRTIGVVLALFKGDPDWERALKFKEIASPVDDLVREGISQEEAGNTDKAIQVYQDAVARIEGLTLEDSYASAHRRLPSPINRLSILLAKRKDYDGALAVLERYFQYCDPVQPHKEEREAIRKRFNRLKTKAG